MLMPSQSPPPTTTTIQTLPSDQQQQQQQQQQKKRQQDEYVDTLNSQKDNTIKKRRRKKSMEFDDDARYSVRINDDINNNYSNFETNGDMNKSETSESSSSSSIDDETPLTIPLPSSSPMMNIETNSIPTKKFSILSSSTDSSSPLVSTRRPIRPAATAATANRRLAGGDHDSISSLNNINEPDPNVFLISSDTNSHNTIRKTKHDVKRFVMYIDEQFGEQKPLHTLPAESLCRYLKHYFENTKKFDGTQYEPDTLRSFLLSIERYLKSKQYEYNLMESPLFQPCRQVIMTKREQWRKMGGGNHSNTHHNSKSTLSTLNLKNVTVFDRTKPDGLLLEVYVHISKLYQDKVLSITQLLWGDIALINEQYLVCQQNQSDSQATRLNATPNQLSTCPVQAYRLYATHRPPQCNTTQSPFFLMPRATTAHHTWYKTTAAGKNLEQVLHNAIQHQSLPKQSSSSSLITPFKVLDHSQLTHPLIESHSSTINSFNGKRNETRLSTSSLLPLSKRIHSSPSLVQPLNLSVNTTNLNVDDDTGIAASPSPSNSLSNDVMFSSGFNKTPSLLNDFFSKQSISSSATPVWDESVTEILLTVAKQRDTRVMKINVLRAYLEEKLGVVEFLCLYRGFKSEPKLTFQGTPWEHYQRFLPVLFTLLALDNTIT